MTAARAIAKRAIRCVMARPDGSRCWRPTHDGSALCDPCAEWLDEMLQKARERKKAQAAASADPTKPS